MQSDEMQTFLLENVSHCKFYFIEWHWPLKQNLYMKIYLRHHNSIHVCENDKKGP